ncbi:hypothetical protein K466DRAFT_569131 [Polyporus arcularius HHB13444]|uniref:Uncharacterized protein n=1 Tax=Polyporus arcularius HHB13444 TaxID=1314778 RepID=A0A5C3NZ18_9APHY|nr:hypothetical protein K466DRAFT_569131 [Polyporus arcularius HHB13444]
MHNRKEASAGLPAEGGVNECAEDYYRIVRWNPTVHKTLHTLLGREHDLDVGRVEGIQRDIRDCGVQERAHIKDRASSYEELLAVEGRVVVLKAHVAKADWGWVGNQQGAERKEELVGQARGPEQRSKAAWSSGSHLSAVGGGRRQFYAGWGTEWGRVGVCREGVPAPGTCGGGGRAGVGMTGAGRHRAAAAGPGLGPRGPTRPVCAPWTSREICKTVDSMAEILQDMVMRVSAVQLLASVLLALLDGLGDQREAMFKLKVVIRPWGSGRLWLEELCSDSRHQCLEGRLEVGLSSLDVGLDHSDSINPEKQQLSGRHWAEALELTADPSVLRGSEQCSLYPSPWRRGEEQASGDRREAELQESNIPHLEAQPEAVCPTAWEWPPAALSPPQHLVQSPDPR